MKWLSILLGIVSFVATVSARCRPFYLEVANSPNDMINGLQVQNNDGLASFGNTGAPVIGCFSDTGELWALGEGIEDGQDTFFLVPTSSTSGVEELVFADFAVSEARFTDFRLVQPDEADEANYLTYGPDADRFSAFPGRSGTGWVIYWVPAGGITTADGFSIDLKVQWV